MAEERKLATILFADLAGSTALADEQDPERTRDDLAGVDAHSQREPLLQAVLHRKRRVQRPLRVVLERLRRAEGGHHGIPRELLDRPAGAPDLLGHGVVEALQPGDRRGARGQLLRQR
jgi:hypothetical protein